MDIEDIEIAKAELCDIEDILLIQTQTRVSNFDRQDFIRAVADQSYIFLIAKLKKNPVGFVFARLITNKTSASTILSQQTSLFLFEIYSIAVGEKFQKSGVGQKLLEYMNLSILGQFKINSFEIQLESRESNTRAIAFYLKHGFSVDGVRKNYYSNPSENALLFSRKVIFETT